MQTTRRTLTLTVLVAFALLAGACSSSGSNSKSAEDQQTTTTVGGGGNGTSDTTDGADAADTTAPESPDGDPTSVEWVSAMGTGDTTVTWTKDKAFDPDRVTVAVGDVVEFVAGPDAPVAGIGLADNGSDSKTVTAGMSESFRFTKPGTFTFHEQVTEAEVTVEVTG